MYLNPGSGPTTPPDADTHWKQNANPTDPTEKDSPQNLILQQLVEPVINGVLAPLVACSGDLDGAVRQLKTSVIRYLRNAGIPPEIAGHHLGRCERSIYRHLEAQRRPDDTDRPMKRLLAFLEHRTATAGDCARHLQQRYPSLTSSTVNGMLDAQVALGLLRKTTEETGRQRSVRYEQVQSDREKPRVLRHQQVSADVMADIHAFVLTRLDAIECEDPGIHASNRTILLTGHEMLTWLEPATKGGSHEP